MSIIEQNRCNVNYHGHLKTGRVRQLMKKDAQANYDDCLTVLSHKQQKILIRGSNSFEPLSETANKVTALRRFLNKFIGHEWGDVWGILNRKKLLPKSYIWMFGPRHCRLYPFEIVDGILRKWSL